MTRNSKKLKRKTNTNYIPPQAPPDQSQRDNPFGLPFVVPTEMVDLPSEGSFYPSTSPLCGVKQVEIKHMTAKEEDLLSNIDETNNSNIFERLIDGLLVDPNLQATDFLEEDKIAILYNARKTGYGKEYAAISFCENCNKSTKFIFDLEKKAIKKSEKEVDFDPDNNCFAIELPVTGLKANLKRMSPKDLDILEEEKQKKASLGLEFNYTVSYLLRALDSINEVSEKKTLSALLEVLPAADAKFLLNYDKNIFPQIDTTQEVACTVCGTVAEREVPLSWAFFRIDI